MSFNKQTFKDGISLEPKTLSTNAFTGDFEVLLGDGRMYYWNASNDIVVTQHSTDTLTNKILSGNTATNLINGAGTFTFNTSGAITVPNGTDTLVGRNTTDTLTNKSMDGNNNTFTNIGSGSLPADVVYLNAVQTLTNKTLTSPIISTIINTGTLTLPTSTDTLVGRNTTDTLTNKTLTSPIIATIINSGTLTLPTSTDTLVGRTTTDTLSNKTLSGPTVVNGTLDFAQTNDTTTTGANVDLALPSISSILFANTSLTSVRSIGAGATGQILFIKNNTTNPFTIVNESAGATATNRITTGTNADITFTFGSSLLLEYDGTAQRWCVIGGSGTATPTANYTTDTFSGNNSTTTFTLSVTPGSVNSTFVFISGVYQNKSGYSIVGTTLTFTTAPPTGSSNIQVVTISTTSIGTPADGTVTRAKANVSSLFPTPTQQRFTSGTAQTYTTPANVTYIRVRMVGGGGGGGGSNVTTPGGNTGGSGGNSTFGTSLLTANGGNGGSAGSPGGGGSATISAPAIGSSFTGTQGGSGGLMNTGSPIYNSSGQGGNSVFGGGGGNVYGTATGGAGTTNSGSGGGGAGYNPVATNGYSGGGGGSGAYIDALISAPSATYLYTVGALGNGGTGGAATGGAGAAGYIEVTEYYQ